MLHEVNCLSSVRNDERYMHARVALLGNPSQCPDLPLFATGPRTLYKAPEGCWPVFPASYRFATTESEIGAWQSIFYICVHDHSPHHCTSSRECSPRSSCHQSRISMHDGRGVDLHDSIRNECTYTHNKAWTPSWVIRSVGDRESRHVSSLGVRNVPRFPCLGLNPIPNTLQYPWHTQYA